MVEVNAKQFAKLGLKNKIDVSNKPLIKSSDKVERIDDGEVIVAATGEKVSATDSEMGSIIKHAKKPVDAPIVCELRARGILFFKPNKNFPQLSKKLRRAMEEVSGSQFKYHSQLLTSVESSYCLSKVFKNKVGIRTCKKFTQVSKVLKFSSELTVKQMNKALMYTQLSIDKFTGEVPALRNFIGKIQMLQIANGIVLIMEMSARLLAPEYDCKTTAGLTWQARVFGGDRPLKQNIGSRLEKIYDFLIAD